MVEDGKQETEVSLSIGTCFVQHCMVSIALSLRVIKCMSCDLITSSTRGDFFANDTQSPAIVCSVSYRLGAFGFLTTSAVDGNFGFLDQQVRYTLCTLVLISTTTITTTATATTAAATTYF